MYPLIGHSLNRAAAQPFRKLIAIALTRDILAPIRGKAQVNVPQPIEKRAERLKLYCRAPGTKFKR
ncbi:MAG: hypothetical protein HKO13_01955 [Sphingomonas sp.]|nr:hypothetical protein [Sphingomonas sp.]